jgi:putative SOS response-associated peptidase YedK
VAPSEDVLAISRSKGSNENSAARLHWGLIPFWIDDPDEFNANLINARAETVTEKASFREPIRKRRCLIPTNGFYEWKQENGSKQPYYIYPSEDELFTFAGIWDHWSDDDRNRSLNSCAILTTEANDTMKPIHDRMPVIISSEDHDDWLQPDKIDGESLKQILESPDNPSLRMHPVSKRVNNPTFDEETCIEPIENS